MKADLLTFYLDGRTAKLHHLRKVTDDFDEIAERVVKHDVSVREAIDGAMTRGRQQLAGDKRYKQRWLKEHEEALEDVKPDEAFDAFLEGLADELAFSLEPEVLEAIEEEIDGPDEDDEDEGDEEDDEDAEDDGKEAGEPD